MTGPAPNLGTAPDLTDFNCLPHAAHEWWLSDHPWAVAARARRREASTARELANAAAVTAWIDRTRAADAAGDLLDRPDGWRDNLVGLAESMGRVVEANQRRVAQESATPDDVWLAEARHRLETHMRVSGEDHDYTFPAHLIGPGAAAYPPPPEGFPAIVQEDSRG